MRLQNLLWITLVGGMICWREKKKERKEKVSEVDEDEKERRSRRTSRFFIPFKNFFEALSV